MVNEIHVEGLEEILEDVGISISHSIVEKIVEMYDDAMGEEVAMYHNGIKGVECKLLSDDQILDKVDICPKCDGRGGRTMIIGAHTAWDECERCKGRGIIIRG